MDQTSTTKTMVTLKMHGMYLAWNGAKKEQRYKREREYTTITVSSLQPDLDKEND